MARIPAPTIYPPAARGMHEIHPGRRGGPRLRPADLRKSDHRTHQVQGRILQVLDLYHRPQPLPDEIARPAWPSDGTQRLPPRRLGRRTGQEPALGKRTAAPMDDPGPRRIGKRAKTLRNFVLPGKK